MMRDFLKLEAASSTLLMLATVCALIAANSPLLSYYRAMQSHHVSLVINDGLMAIFFLVVGIEIKHEMAEGSLSSRSQAMLPALAALGGVITPALIYSSYNWGAPSIRGWAIPSATDIAFSLGVLSFFGKRIPSSLKIFLMAVAIMDDLAAVAIIATFYTEKLDSVALAAAIGCAALIYAYNRKNIRHMTPYLLAGGAMWAALMESGVHPTIAGVALGLLMPMSLGKKLVERVGGFVAFGIVPLFAFANAGIPLGNVNAEALGQPVTMGIAVGLILGKPIGILVVTALLCIMRLAALPPGSNWWQFTGIAMMAGIGFTMSLFIGALAFGTGELMVYTRLGVMAGSLVSALAGALCLMLSLMNKKDAA